MVLVLSCYGGRFVFTVHSASSVLKKPKSTVPAWLKLRLVFQLKLFLKTSVICSAKASSVNDRNAAERKKICPAWRSSSHSCSGHACKYDSNSRGVRKFRAS